MHVLQKGIYGLKQAPKLWNDTLTAFFAKLGFVAAHADASLWIKRTDPVTYIDLIVDDMLITSSSNKHTLETVETILKAYPGTHKGIADWFNGHGITWLPAEHACILTQTAHIEDMLKKFGLDKSPPKGIPMPAGQKLTKVGDMLDVSQFQYSSLVGSLLYLDVCTRPDIAYSVNKLARFMSCPTQKHWSIAVGVAKYLAGTKYWGLKLGHSNLPVVGYCDAAYASCPDTARSTTGYVFCVYGGVVSYKSTLQPTIACSTTEAEYQACSSAAREARWLRLLLPDFKVPCTPIDIYTDSAGALSAIVNNAMTERTKHVDVHHHFVEGKGGVG